MKTANGLGTRHFPRVQYLKNYNTLLKALKRKENLRERFIVFMDSENHSVKMSVPKNSNLWGKHSIRSEEFDYGSGQPHTASRVQRTSRWGDNMANIWWTKGTGLAYKIKFSFQ